MDRMEEVPFVGREAELQKLLSIAGSVKGGSGAMVLLGGEAGVGKTRLTSEFERRVAEEGFKVLRGMGLAESMVPLLSFKEALRSGNLEHLASRAPAPRLLRLYLMTKGGLLVSEEGRTKEEMDPDILSGMLTAVGQFVKDSLEGMVGASSEGLRGMSYGQHRFVLEHSGELTIVAIVKGRDSEFLRSDMVALLQNVQAGFGDRLDAWDGNYAGLEPVGDMLLKLLEGGKYDGLSPSSLDPRLRQENLFESVLVGLRRECSKQPVLMILDDLHWADATTLGLLHYIARNTRGSRLMLMGTYRPEDLIAGARGKEHKLKAVMAAMDREDLLTSLDLHRFKDSGVLISQALGGGAVHPDLLARLQAESEGNPFFIIELVRLLKADGTIVQAGESWSIARGEGSRGVPSRIVDLVERRVGRLAPEMRDILECGSVIGEEFQAWILHEIMGTERMALLKSLAEMERTHRLVRGVNGGFRFDHAKIREVLYKEIPTELKREYHLLVGEALEGGVSSEGMVDALAHHFYRARDPRAVDYGIMAGDLHKEEYANEEAVTRFTQALELMTGRDQRRASVHEKLGGLYLTLANFDVAIEHYLKTREMTRQGKVKAETYWKIALAEMRRGAYHDALKVLELGLEFAGDDYPLERGKLLAEKAHNLCQVGDYEAAKGAAQAAMVLLRMQGATEVEVAPAEKYLALAVSYTGGWKEAAMIYERMLERIGDEDIFLAGSIWSNLGMQLAYTGRLKQARGCFEESVARMEKLGDKRTIALTTMNLSWSLRELGLFDEAEAKFLRAYNMSSSHRDVWTMFLTLGNLFDVYIRKPDYERARWALDEGNKLHAELGENIEAVQQLLHRSILATHEGQLSEGEQHARAALAEAGEKDHKRFLGMAQHYLGFNLRVQQRFDEARPVLERALEIQEDQRLMRMRTVRELGMLETQAGNVDEAKELLDKCLAEFTEMGAAWDVEETEKAMRGEWF